MKRLLLLMAFLVFSATYSIAQMNDTDTVYVTKSGSKYHKANCTLTKGKSTPKLYGEVKGSYEPCSKCFGKTGNTTNKHKATKNGSSTATSTSTTSTYSGDREIHTGPRGGKYYINSNGKKTYIKRKK